MSEDFLTINTDQAAATEAHNTDSGNGRQQDPTLWKPSIGKIIKEYEALVRLLPQGINGVKNKLPASVSYKMHYLKNHKHKIYKNVQCRKTLGDDCPVCEAAWSIYNAGKDQNSKDLMDLGKSQLPSTRHVINLFIKEDLTVSENDGKVLKWDHTDKMNRILMDPLRDDDVKEGEVKSKFKKAKEKFTPYSPRDGRNRFIIVEEDPSKRKPNGDPMPTYDNSYWDEDGLSDLAATSEEMMAILEQCYDLSSYRDIPTSEELMSQYNEFLGLVDAKERNALVTNVQTNRVETGGNPAASVKQNVSSGDAASYFEGSTGGNATTSTEGDATASTEGEDMLNMNSGDTSVEAPTESSVTKADDAPISDSMEDDLPF